MTTGLIRLWACFTLAAFSVADIPAQAVDVNSVIDAFKAQATA